MDESGSRGFAPSGLLSNPYARHGLLSGLSLRSSLIFWRLGRRAVTELVRFLKPICDGCFYLIPVRDVNHVYHFGLGYPVNASDRRCLDRTGEKNAEFKKTSLRAHEEVTGLPREHDRLVRGVHALITEGHGSVP